MKISNHLLALALVSMPFVSHAESMDKPHCERSPVMQFDAEKPHDGMPSMHGLPPHLAGLDLTDAQQDKIFALIYPLMPQMREHGKQRHQLVEELHKLSSAEVFDEVKAKQIAEKLATLEKDATFKRAQIDSQIFVLLTAEQRKQLSERKPHQHEGFSNSKFQSRSNLRPETKHVF